MTELSQGMAFSYDPSKAFGEPMRSSVGLGAEDMVFRGGRGTRGGIGGKTGVRPVDIGEGGVGGRGSTRAADVWWARSRSSCSSSGVERTRSSVGWVAVGVCSSGVEDSESSSWLDRNPNQVGFGGFLREMVANYYGDSRDKEKLDLLLRFVRVGLNVASENGSRVRGGDYSRVEVSEYRR